MAATPPQDSASGLELSIVMPCLNEAQTLPVCIRKALGYLKESGVTGEVIVADNGSVDGSRELAAQLGARVVSVQAKGYGSALNGGIRAARGRYVIMGDSDDSYDFSSLHPFVEKLRQGSDLVMGNRFRGGIAPGAMPPLHRYFGNPILTALARFFFRVPCGDVYCGLRGFKKSAFEAMDLQSSGMEFALEMVVKSKLLGMQIAEVPTTLSPDGRGRSPHLRSWKDGRRSLRFYLVCSPNWLFLYPGMVMTLLGTALGCVILAGPLNIGGVNFDIHTLVFSACSILIGVQAVYLSLYARMLAVDLHLLPAGPWLEKSLKKFRLEYFLMLGALFVLGGVAGSVSAVKMWQQTSFTDLDPFKMMRLVIPSAFSITLGFQIAFSSIYLSFLRIRFRQSSDRSDLIR